MHRDVDLVVLTRDDQPLRTEVAEAIHSQRLVGTALHRVIAAPRPDESHRRATIARGRNAGRKLGRAPFVMFVDDDVVLDEHCAGTLVTQLLRRPLHAALAADYLGESARRSYCRHVGMGATLFHRWALDQIQFRWEADKCECQCCCDDLRRLGLEIGYQPQARATHLVRHAAARHGGPSAADPPAAIPAAVEGRPLAGRILVAFDRCHLDPFRRRFLPSLRAAGNEEWVTAVVYGLFPSQLHHLAREHRLEVVAVPVHHDSPARRRLWDFQPVVERLPPQTPVAYWDAGDMIFQTSLATLWELVRRHPDKLLATHEPGTFLLNGAAHQWATTIHDPAARTAAIHLFVGRPVLNSGFAAGTALTFLQYLRAAAAAYESPALAGSSDWGDQTALNFFCRSHPDRWLEVDQGWNYCLCRRETGQVVRDGAGSFRRRSGGPIHVVHGNAKSLPANLRLHV